MPGRAGRGGTVTARPRDWSPLYESDPVPGDPHEVAQLGKKLRGMAEEIEKQARNINALASVDDWDSDAGRAFHLTAGDTAGRLKKAYDRYDEAATAVGTKVVDGESDEYAGELHRAQRMADQGLEEYRAAEVDYKAAAKVLDPLNGKVLTGEDAVQHSKQQKKQDDAAELMLQAEKKILRATQIRDDAARRAARRIKNVIHHDGVKDPGGFMDWIADHADWFSAAATVLAVVALAAAIVFTGGLAAPIIAGLAAVASGTALSGRLYDVFARGGKFDALKTGLDVLGVFPGLGALRGLTATARGGRMFAAQRGVWEGFTNGFGVKRINDVTRIASKFLSKRGFAKGKLPAEGFNPEVVTRYIKGASLTHLVTRTVNRLGDGHRHDGAPASPPGDARPTPAPDLSPSSSGGSGTPSPTPQPSPSSSAFRAALAPAG
ncbi:putative T7SS-secreted protein [Streptomyces shenzhenensis]|uniref:putative T7SS-secreted protein n=1 Tax=Streptomyces shenzhenensis TaxID=943815 RepID=UPI00380D09EE